MGTRDAGVNLGPRTYSGTWQEKVQPKKLLMVHGEEPSQAWFSARFADTLRDTEIIRPDTHTPIELW